MFRQLICVVVTVLPLLGQGTNCLSAAEPRRTPWTTSRLVGSPEPPLPYVLKRAYPLEFLGPISLNRVPESNLLLVLEQGGKVFSFDSASPTPEKSLFADFNLNPPPNSGVTEGGPRRIELFSIAFHPNFEANRFAYVCYITLGGDLPTDTHIARFTVSSDVIPKLKLESEQPILKCEGGGHNGCTLAFGNDGMLYVSIGDLESPNPPDPRNTGQDISDLYASILRIDVDHRDETNNYRIPDDNPFVHLSTARGEVYAYGFRNPFRMSFDPETGDLWAGDVGWEAWEMVYRIRPGGNYGWSITEGPGQVKADQPRGPTPIPPADIALGHAEAASVTGGMVYRGRQYPDLYGTYIFGDWITRKYWAATFNSEQVTGWREVAFGSVKPVCFECTRDGELLVLDYVGANQPSGIHRFVPNPAAKVQQQPFPRALSETGLFANTADYVLADGVSAYSVNAPMWKDGAQSDFFVAIPGTSSATFYSEPQTTFDWFTTRVRLPRGSVLGKTYSLPTETKGEWTRIETQIALKDEQGEWQYYSYRWNSDGSEADLVSASGEIAVIPVADGKDSLAWNFASRTSCRVCHTPWRGEALGFVEEQLRAPESSADSWRELISAGVAELNGTRGDYGAGTNTCMVNPADERQPVDRRARSYLHANCAHCHLFGGNASTSFDISFEKPLGEAEMINVPPMRGDLGLSGARIVTPGKPSESVLCFRVSTSGSGRMPHIGSQRTDPLAIQLIRHWVAQLPQNEEHLRWLDTVCGNYQNVSNDQRLEAARQLLSTTGGALELSSAMAEGRVPRELMREIVDASRSGSQTAQDLMEPFAESDQRTPKLGEGFDAEQVLSLRGDAVTGSRLFSSGVGTCSNCHRAGTTGRQVGPDLTGVATRLKTREAVFESVANPSKEIHKDFQTKSLLTVDGDIFVGTIIQQSEQALLLRDANGKVTEFSQDSIEAVKDSKISLMPENLLAPLSAQQAADLLAYLESLTAE